MHYPFERYVYSPGTEAELASDKDKNKVRNGFSLLTCMEGDLYLLLSLKQ